MLPPTLAARAADLAEDCRAHPENPDARALAAQLDALTRGTAAHVADHRLAGRVVVLLAAVWVGWLIATFWRGGGR
jgi:hypothetical protein